jgi:hypothetical protein
MARAQRNNSPTSTSGDTPQSRRVPGILTCPVCDVPLGDGSPEVHLQEHKPTVGCIMCTGHTDWRIDWDNVVYHPERSLFYCRPCGRFAPVTMAPAPAVSLQDKMGHDEEPRHA